MVVSDAHVFTGFLTPVLTQLFFPKPQTTFLTCFCRGERQKYTGSKVCLNRGSNSQPPGHESDTHTHPGGASKQTGNDSSTLTFSFKNSEIVDSQTSPVWFFLCPQYKCFKNTVGKGEIARDEQFLHFKHCGKSDEQFLLFPQCFLPVQRTFCHFNQI